MIFIVVDQAAIQNNLSLIICKWLNLQLKALKCVILDSISCYLRLLFLNSITNAWNKNVKKRTAIPAQAYTPVHFDAISAPAAMPFKIIRHTVFQLHPIFRSSSTRSPSIMACRRSNSGSPGSA